MSKESYIRSRSLLGDEAFERLSSMHVAVFGVGGVGGWCAEALLRTGVRHLTLVDDDLVAESNINRQRQAIQSTVGKPKVNVLRDLLLDIVPEATIEAIATRYTSETAHTFSDLLDSCNFVIDAIDSVDCKIHLIQRCLTPSNGYPAAIFSSMGAALRTDPTKVRIAPFHKVIGDGLAKAMRNRFRKSGTRRWRERQHNAGYRRVRNGSRLACCASGKKRNCDKSRVSSNRKNTRSLGQRTTLC